MFTGTAGGPATARSASLRPVELPRTDPYRMDPSARPIAREVEPRTLGDVIAAVRAAGLGCHARRRGFDLQGAPRSRVMPVRVHEITRIAPQDLACGGGAPELLLDLALAVLPLYGPLIVELPFAGELTVDGHQDRAALGEEAAERIQRVGRRVAARAPISFPILIDLARRMRQPR